MSVCPLCHRRRARRACPARRETICAVCCGTKRLVEIACPPDCAYLHAAERHPPAIVKRQQEQDLGILLEAAVGFSEPQLHLFLLLQSAAAGFAPTGLGRLIDRDVAEAAGMLAATFETATRGVIYEHQAASPVAEALRRELQTLLVELGRGAGTRFEREAAQVLRGIERAAKHDIDGMPEGERAYLEMVERSLSDSRRGADTRPGPSGASPIILP